VAAPGSQPTADPSPEVAGRVGLSWVPARLLFGRASQPIPADFFDAQPEPDRRELKLRGAALLCDKMA